MTSSERKPRIKIENILNGEYSDFLIYCGIAGKTYTDEITDVDYIAYRSRFGYGKADAKKLRDIIENTPREEDNTDTSANDEPIQISPSSDYFADPQNLKRAYADILAVNPENYKDISLKSSTASAFAEVLSARILNGLNRNDCFTLADLLQMTPEELRGVRNLGAKSVKIIEKALSRLVNFVPPLKRPNQRIFVRKTVVRPIVKAMIFGEDYSLDGLFENEKRYFEFFAAALKDAGNDFCAALLDESKRGYIKSVLDTAAELYERNTRKAQIIKDAKNTVENLTGEILSKSVMPFMRLCPAPQWKSILKEFEIFITPGTKVSQYAKAVEILLERSSISIHSLESGIGAFQEWIKGADIQRECEEIFVCRSSREERFFDTLRERISGQTLAEIAARRGLTRERVRQLEKNAVLTVCERIYKSKYNIFGLIAAYIGEYVLRRDDITNAAGMQYGGILWHCARDLELMYASNPPVRYDSASDTVVVFDCAADTYNADDYAEIVKTTVAELPKLIETAELHAKLKDAAKNTGIYEKLFIIEASKQYETLGIYSTKESVTVAQMCGIILKKQFPNGYKISNKYDSERFIKYMRDFFGKTSGTSPRAIDMKIMEVGVLTSRGKYVHSDYFNVKRDIIDAVTDYVEASPKSAITYSEIFTALEDIFKGTMITNRYALQGAMKLYGCPYESHRDYIVKSDGKDMTAELTAFIKAAGCVRKSEIFTEFPGWRDSNLALLLPRCPEIIPAGNGIYIHSDMLDITEDDRRKIREYLDANIFDIPVSARYLHRVFSEIFPEFIAKNNIKNYEKLFGILKYMFADVYFFSHYFISKTDIGIMTNRSVILMLLKDTDTVKIGTLADICRERGIGYVSLANLADMTAPEFIRIGADDFMRSEKIGITDAMYADIAALINNDVSAHGGYIAASQINDFSRYPALNVPWTPFLLESTADLIPNNVNVVKIPSSLSNITRSIFVCDEYAGCDWQNLTLEILKSRHTSEPFKSKTDARKWLQRQGLSSAKSSAALEIENRIFFDEGGKLQIK